MRLAFVTACANPNPVECVELITPPRDVMAEVRTLARRANALHAEGLTAWHARATPSPPCPPTPEMEPPRSSDVPRPTE